MIVPEVPGTDQRGDVALWAEPWCACVEVVEARGGRGQKTVILLCRCIVTVASYGQVCPACQVGDHA